jgi:ABC-2 type transport system ATP-binding protein
MSLIEAKGLSKHFKVLNHREGLIGAMKDLFSTDFRIVKAVDDISFSTITHLRMVLARSY